MQITVKDSLTAEAYTLVNAADQKIEKNHINASFDSPNRVFTITQVDTEEALKESITEPKPFRLTHGRIRLPRIGDVHMYWPPSDRVMNKVAELAASPGGLKREHLNRWELEGTYFQAIWEPICRDHPAVRGENTDQGEPESQS